jgi:hypothetical protein
LACERYRIATGAFPRSLEVLVNEKFLDRVPADPIDNQPMRYRMMQNCVVIYSIGSDEKDDNGKTNDNRWLGLDDVGIRLWTPEARRQAPQDRIRLPE